VEQSHHIAKLAQWHVMYATLIMVRKSTLRKKTSQYADETPNMIVKIRTKNVRH